MLLSLLFACAVGSSPEPVPASPSGQLSQQAAAIADDAAKVESLATELEARTDELRREVAAGTTSQADAIAELQELAARLEAAHAEVDGKIDALEADTREAAGMDAPEPVEKRR